MRPFPYAAATALRALSAAAATAMLAACVGGSTAVMPVSVPAPVSAATASASVLLQPGTTATLPIIGIGSVTTTVGAVPPDTLLQAASRKSATADDGSFSVVSTFTSSTTLSASLLSRVVLGIDPKRRVCVSVLSGDPALVNVGRACFEATGMQGLTALTMAKTFHGGTFAAGTTYVAQFDVTPTN